MQALKKTFILNILYIKKLKNFSLNLLYLFNFAAHHGSGKHGISILCIPGTYCRMDNKSDFDSHLIS